MKGSSRYLAQWLSLRSLWNAWDPIGLRAAAKNIRGEYEPFVGPTLHLLESGATPSEIAAYIAYSLNSRLGANVTARDADAFACNVRDWYVREAVALRGNELA